MNIDFYRDSDFILGVVINVWGRKFFICDVDEFIKEYYYIKYGIGKYNFLNFYNCFYY